MIKRLLAWFERMTCSHPIELRDYRFRWFGEYADAYEECLKCGKEFFA